MSKKLPAKYRQPKNALRIEYSNVNQACFLMWNTQVLQINPDADILIAEFERIQSKRAWVEVSGHEPNQNKEIADKIVKTLDGYYHEYHGVESLAKNSKPTGAGVVKVHYFKNLDSQERGNLMKKLESVLEPFGYPKNLYISLAEQE